MINRFLYLIKKAILEKVIKWSEGSALHVLSFSSVDKPTIQGQVVPFNYKTVERCNTVGTYCTLLTIHFNK